jgi:hypothetical protein
MSRNHSSERFAPCFRAFYSSGTSSVSLVLGFLGFLDFCFSGLFRSIMSRLGLGLAPGFARRLDSLLAHVASMQCQ